MKEQNERENSLRLSGRNAVLEAFRAGKPFDRLIVEERLSDPALLSLTQELKEKGVPVKVVRHERFVQLEGSENAQGVIAYIASYEYSSVDEILRCAAEKGEDPFLILLDGIEDPHNLGAIIRSAEQAGAHGVVIPKDRSASLNQTVARTSAGALNYLPVARVTNLKRTAEELKKQGLWITAADMDGEIMYDADLTGPIALVIGNEGKGISELMKKTCDRVVSIPAFGKVDSLNASVAAGVLMYEVVRQRRSHS